MSTTDHDAVRDLAALYALGALPADEGTAFVRHLATCEECLREVRAFGVVVNALPLALPQIDPPPMLRARVLAGVVGVMTEGLVRFSGLYTRRPMGSRPGQKRAASI